jgi:hypothetical protein
MKGEAAMNEEMMELIMSASEDEIRILVAYAKELLRMQEAGRFAQAQADASDQ